jgi:hypothetical protein
MFRRRIDGFTPLDPAVIAAHAAAGERIIVQFGRSGYTDEQLAELNQLAKLHGRALEILPYIQRSRGAMRKSRTTCGAVVFASMRFVASDDDARRRAADALTQRADPDRLQKFRPAQTLPRDRPFLVRCERC